VTEDVELQSRLARALRALVGACVSVLFGALAVGTATTPISGPPLAGWLLRAAFVLLFAAMALGSAWFAVGAIRGERSRGQRRRARGVPAEALARCLTCGALAPHDAACPACEEPPAYRAGAFQVERKGILAGVLLAIVGVALLFFGVCVAVGPYGHGERRPWALAMFAALGLLLVTAGGACVWGSVVALREALGGISRLSFEVDGPDRVACGMGAAVWGELAWLEGESEVTGPIVPGAVPGGYRAAAGDEAFAEMVATLDAAGIVHLDETTTYAWRLGDKPAPGALPARRATLPYATEKTRETTVSLAMNGRLAAAETADPAGVEEARRDHAVSAARFFARWLAQPVSLPRLRRALEADPAHRAQAEAHARSLRDRGVPVASELVEAIRARSSG
jgi:hypothetical protein